MARIQNTKNAKSKTKLSTPSSKGKVELHDDKTLEIHTVKKNLKKNAPVIKVEKVTKKFGGFVALNKVTFEVAKGERIGLIGGNGAGKTTMAEIIAGINKPTSGNIEFGFHYTDSPKEGVGMQFQQSEYPSGLTVKDIVVFARNLRKLNMTNDEVKDLLDVFQMGDFYNRKVRSLSGGQRQKLNILLSIIHNPKLVILDELSTGLDISARENIIKFTDELLSKNNISAILISHHMEEIKALCSRVVVLDNGNIVADKKISVIEKEYGSLGEFSKKLIAESNLKTIEKEKQRLLNKKTNKRPIRNMLAKKMKQKKGDK